MVSSKEGEGEGLRRVGSGVGSRVGEGLGRKSGGKVRGWGRVWELGVEVWVVLERCEVVIVGGFWG